MGRVSSSGEAQAIASARNAVTVYAVLAAIAATLIWLAQDALGKDLAMADNAGEVRNVLRVAFTIYAGSAVVHVLAAVGIQRAWTAAWALAVAVDSLIVLGLVASFLDVPARGPFVGLVVTAWVLSRLLDKDVVRAFTRSGKRATPPPDPVEEEWRPPTVTPFPPAAPVTPFSAPAAPPAAKPSAGTFDYFG